MVQEDTGLIHKRLYWLPDPQSIHFKLHLTLYKLIHGLTPAYLSQLWNVPVPLSRRGHLFVVTLYFTDLNEICWTGICFGRTGRLEQFAVLHSQLSVCEHFQTCSQNLLFSVS